MDRASFDRQLEKGLDVQGASSELVPGASAIHQLTAEAEHPEYRWLRLERFAMGTGFDAAVAAQNSRVGLFNPAGSGMLIMPRQLMIDSALAATYSIRIGTLTTWDSQAAGFLTDLRYGPPSTVRATGRIVLLTSAGAAGGNLIGFLSVPASSTLIIPLGNIVLPPGTDLCIETAAVNLTASATFTWVERAAESGELLGSGV